VARRLKASSDDDGGSIVLDSEGLFKASRNRRLMIRLHVAKQRDADIVVSAATLAEVLSGHQRDAAVYRVLSKFTVVPVTRKVGTEAGRLRGAAGFAGGAQAIDAIVVATARDRKPPVRIMTSDVGDLTKLVDGHPGVKVVLV